MEESNHSADANDYDSFLELKQHRRRSELATTRNKFFGRNWIVCQELDVFVAISLFSNIVLKFYACLDKQSALSGTITFRL